MARGHCKIFVGGISAQTTTEALRTHFSKYGRLVDAVVMSKNGRPRGFGFVTYDAPASACKALAQPQWLDGRLVDVKRAVPGERTQERSSNKIFVGGLPQDVSTEDLKAYFGGYGPVADAVVMVDRRTSRSRGFGFVRFAGGPQGGAAAEAVMMDFASHHLAGKWVEVKRATPAAVLQALSPCDGGPDGFLSCASLAAMDPSMSLYLMDMSGFDGTCPYSPPTPTGLAVAGVATPARGHARGRRGRRRKQRSSTGSDWPLGGAGDDLSEDGADDCSPCSVALTGSSIGSPVNKALGTPPLPPPGLDGMVGCAAAVTSAPAAVSWGSQQSSQGMLKPWLPLTVEPMNCHGMGSEPMMLTPGRRNKSGSSSVGGGSADGDLMFEFSEASYTAPRVPGVDASPMKVNCRDDSFGPIPWGEDWPKGCTREDFLAVEVRPWLSAW